MKYNWIIWIPLAFSSIYAQTELILPVDRALIYIDRAEVVRRGKVDLKPGANKLIIRGLSPKLLDNSLRASFPTSNKVNIVSIHSYRQPNINFQKKEYRQLYEQRKQLETDKKQLLAKIEILKIEKKQVDRFQSLSARSIAEQIAYIQETPPVENWQKTMLDFRENFRRIERKMTSYENQVVEIERQIKESDKKLEIIRSQSEKDSRHTEINIYLTGKQTGHYDLQISYLIKGCSWKPAYQLYLSKRNASIQYLAEIQQESGEDWHNVQISLSTSSPNENRYRPRLNATELRLLQKKTKSSFFSYKTKAQMAEKEAYSRKIDRKPQGTGSIESLGSALIFHAKGRVNLNSKKELHKILISNFSSKMKSGYLCVPAQKLSVYRYGILKNETLFPLLPGIASLFRNSGYIGQIKMNYISPAEKFKISLGIENNIRIRYRTEDKSFQQGIIDKDKVKDQSVEIGLENFSTRNRKIEVYESIPVSDTSEVKIRLNRKKTTAGFQEQRDNSGILKWEINLAAGKKTAININYQIQTPK